MSLKAKLEAVIYAAEEPVTLSQLVFLFAEEAFAWKAERDAQNLELALSAESAVEQDGEPAPSDSTSELADLVESVESEPQPEPAEPEPKFPNPNQTASPRPSLKRQSR